MTSKYKAAKVLHIIVGALLVTASSADAADFIWDGATDTWGSAHWLPGPVAGPTAAGNSATVSVGTVSFTGHDTFGNASTADSPDIILNTGGTLSSGGNWFNTIWNLNLNGGTLSADGGHSGWGAFALAGTVTVGGSVASTIGTDGGANSRVDLRDNGTVFDVADVTGSSAADLTIANILANGAGAPWTAGALVKSGAGTMSLSGANTYSGSTTVNDGTLELATGGSHASAVNVRSTAGGTLTIAGTLTMAANTYFSAGTGTGGGTTTIESGAVVDLGGNAVLIGGKQVSGGSGVGTLTINGGTVNVAAASGTGGGADNTRVWLNPYGKIGPSALNLNGGTLSTARTIADGSGGNSTLNFGGGTLKTQLAGDPFAGALILYVNTGGGTIDTDGNSVLIDQPLLHGTGSPDGGLTKIGSGTLTLSSNASTFDGDMTINGGTVSVPGIASGAPATSALGATGTGKNIYVNTGAVLVVTTHDFLGTSTTVNQRKLTVSGGTFDHGNGWFQTLGEVVLENGATLTGGNGANANHNTVFLKGDVTVQGTSASTITSTGSTLLGVHLNSATFVVNETGDATDLAVEVPLLNQAATLAVANLNKSGAGTMSLSATNTYTGTTIVSGGTLDIAANGAVTGSSAVNTRMGATNTISGTVTLAASSSFGVGAGVGGTTGTVILNAGGELNIGGANGFTGIGGRDATGAGLGNGTLTIAGGTLNVGAAGTGTSGLGSLDATKFWMNPYGHGGGVSTLNLDGGTLSTAREIRNGSGGTTVVNFNGGTLQAGASIDFLNNPDTAAINTGGLIFDSQAFSATISKALTHGTGSPDGGLVKLGTGTLTLSSATSSYDGDVVVSNGTVIVSAGAGGANPTTSSLGNPQVSRTVDVKSGATLRFTGHDTFGNASGSPVLTMDISGTIENNGGQFTTLGDIILRGGTLTGTGGANASYQTYNLVGDVDTVGNSASTISSSGSFSGIHLGSSGNATTTFNVTNATGDASTDLTVSAILIDRNTDQGGGSGGLTKSGAGTLALSGASTFTGDLIIEDGTVSDGLQVNSGSPTATGLGNMTTGGREIQVITNGTLTFTANDPLGAATYVSPVETIVDGGTLSHGTKFVTLGNVTLKNGAVMTGGNGVNVNYQTFNLMGTVSATGTSESMITNTGSSLTGTHLGNGSFVVEDVGVGSDLTVAVPLINKAGGAAATLTKSGAGTMTLTGASTYTGRTDVEAGTLVVSGGSLSGPGLIDIGATGGPDANFSLVDGSVSAGGQFVVGAHGVDSLATMAAGTLQINGNLYLGGYGEGTGTGTFTQSGGTNTVTGTVHYGGGGPNSGIYTLGGGKLVTPSFTKVGGGTATFNFNGGTLQPSASNASFLQGLTAVNVNSDSTIDSAGFAITIAQTLLVGSGGGLSAIGGGTLTLSSGASTYTGDLLVSNGTLNASGTTGGANPTTSSLGNPQVARTVRVENGGTLTMNNNDLFGNAASTPTATVEINAGGLVENGARYNILHDLTLNGGELRANGGAVATHPAYLLTGNVTVGGSSASLITANTSVNGFNQIQIGINAAAATTTFTVADATGDASADLTISAVLQNGPSGGVASLAKSGAGTLRLTGANTFTGDLAVSGGTLSIAQNNTITDTSDVTVGVGAKVDLDGGVNDTIDELYLGGQRMWIGTWGSSSSAANNKNDTYFSGTGILTTTDGVMDPMTLFLFK